MQPSPSTKKKSPLWQVLTAVAASLLLVCCLGSLILGRFAPRQQATQPAAQAAIAAPAATRAPRATTASEAPTEAPAATTVPEPTPEPTAVPAPAGPAAVGEAVNAGDFTLTVIEVTQADSFNEYLKPAGGSVYVIADVLIEASGDKVPYNPFYFKVKDSDGREYTFAFGVDGSLASGDLVAGDKARGNVAFEVPATATGLVLSYQPIVLFDDSKPVRVALPDA